MPLLKYSKSLAAFWNSQSIVHSKYAHMSLINCVSEGQYKTQYNRHKVEVSGYLTLFYI